MSTHLRYTHVATTVGLERHKILQDLPPVPRANNATESITPHQRRKPVVVVESGEETKAQALLSVAFLLEICGFHTSKDEQGFLVSIPGWNFGQISPNSALHPVLKREDTTFNGCL